MPTLSKVSFAAIARKKTNARYLDQQLVNQGRAIDVQKKNDLFQSMQSLFQLKNRPLTLRQRLCIPPHK